MAVYFHGSFGLNRSHMAGILKLALNDPGLRDKELAKPFGYGAPFSAKYRSWLNKAGLAEMGYPLKLTPKGTVVWEKDPALTSLTTQWFMHWELTQDPEKAEAWHFFVKEFLPGHASFTRQDLLDGLAKKLSPHSMKHFGPGSKLNKVIARKLIDCYTEESALGALGLLRPDGKRWVYTPADHSLGPWDDVEPLINAYA